MNTLCRGSLIALLLLYGNVQADAGKGMTLKVMVEQESVITNKQGRRETKRVAATKIVPGDEVIYTIHYLNSGDKPAESVFINMPVAEHTTYRDGSARGGATDISYSIDGGKRYGRPDELTIKLSDSRSRPATAADYTHIKWRFNAPVPAGAGGAVSYRTALN